MSADHSNLMLNSFNQTVCNQNISQPVGSRNWVYYPDFFAVRYS